MRGMGLGFRRGMQCGTTHRVQFLAYVMREHASHLGALLRRSTRHDWMVAAGVPSSPRERPAYVPRRDNM